MAPLNVMQFGMTKRAHFLLENMLLTKWISCEQARRVIASFPEYIEPLHGHGGMFESGAHKVEQLGTAELVNNHGKPKAEEDEQVGSSGARSPSPDLMSMGARSPSPDQQADSTGEKGAQIAMLSRQHSRKPHRRGGSAEADKFIWQEVRNPTPEVTVGPAKAGSRYSPRVSALCIMFSRLTDLENVDEVLQVMNALEQREAMIRLGMMNLFNVQKPDRTYNLDLSFEDHRSMLRVLLLCNQIDHGENWADELYVLVVTRMCVVQCTVHSAVYSVQNSVQCSVHTQSPLIYSRAHCLHLH
jgi:hypothetical protein